MSLRHLRDGARRLAQLFGRLGQRVDATKRPVIIIRRDGQGTGVGGHAVSRS